MWRSFSRSQIAAFIATIIDYGVLTFWVEILHQHYPYGVALGSAFGATVNFSLNRHWSFEASEDIWHKQLRRYVMVAVGSLILNTGGVFLLTEFAGYHYLISQVFISISVGLLYNFPLHRFFVYKKKDLNHEITIQLTTTKSENFSEDFNSRTTQSSTT